MRSPRWRPAVPVLAAAMTLLIAACGSTAQATHQPPRHLREVTVTGSLLEVRSTMLTVQDGAGTGTVQVTFAPMATPIYAVTAATTGAIQPGSCVAARGERDATGTVTASAIVVTSSVDDACPDGIEPSPPAPADTSRAPLPPSPSPVPGRVLVNGQVLSLGGGAATVDGPQGDPEVVLLRPGVPVLLFQASGRSALVIPSCLVIQGTRSRHAIAAQKIVDWPPGTQC